EFQFYSRYSVQEVIHAYTLPYFPSAIPLSSISTVLKIAPLHRYPVYLSLPSPDVLILSRYMLSSSSLNTSASSLKAPLISNGSFMLNETYFTGINITHSTEGVAAWWFRTSDSQSIYLSGSYSLPAPPLSFEKLLDIYHDYLYPVYGRYVEGYLSLAFVEGNSSSGFAPMPGFNGLETTVGVSSIEPIFVIADDGTAVLIVAHSWHSFTVFQALKSRDGTGWIVAGEYVLPYSVRHIKAAEGLSRQKERWAGYTEDSLLFSAAGDRGADVLAFSPLLTNLSNQSEEGMRGCFTVLKHYSGDFQFASIWGSSIILANATGIYAANSSNENSSYNGSYTPTNYTVLFSVQESNTSARVLTGFSDFYRCFYPASNSSSSGSINLTNLSGKGLIAFLNIYSLNSSVVNGSIRWNISLTFLAVCQTYVYNGNASYGETLAFTTLSNFSLERLPSIWVPSGCFENIETLEIVEILKMLERILPEIEIAPLLHTSYFSLNQSQSLPPQHGNSSGEDTILAAVLVRYSFAYPLNTCGLEIHYDGTEGPAFELFIYNSSNSTVFRRPLSWEDTFFCDSLRCFSIPPAYYPVLGDMNLSQLDIRSRDNSSSLKDCLPEGDGILMCMYISSEENCFCCSTHVSNSNCGWYLYWLSLEGNCTAGATAQLYLLSFMESFPLESLFPLFASPVNRTPLNGMYNLTLFNTTAGIFEKVPYCPVLFAASDYCTPPYYPYSYSFPYLYHYPEFFNTSGKDISLSSLYFLSSFSYINKSAGVLDAKPPQLIWNLPEYINHPSNLTESMLELKLTFWQDGYKPVSAYLNYTIYNLSNYYITGNFTDISASLGRGSVVLNETFLQGRTFFINRSIFSTSPALYLFTLNVMDEAGNFNSYIYRLLVTEALMQPAYPEQEGYLNTAFFHFTVAYCNVTGSGENGQQQLCNNSLSIAALLFYRPVDAIYIYGNFSPAAFQQNSTTSVQLFYIKYSEFEWGCRYYINSFLAENYKDFMEADGEDNISALLSLQTGIVLHDEAIVLFTSGEGAYRLFMESVAGDCICSVIELNLDTTDGRVYFDRTPPSLQIIGPYIINTSVVSGRITLLQDENINSSNTSPFRNGTIIYRYMPFSASQSWNTGEEDNWSNWYVLTDFYEGTGWDFSLQSPDGYLEVSLIATDMAGNVIAP
ncbi:MAG: hypothetical protein QW728_07550, partial [Thermoplasmata archaeon]